MGIYEEFTSKDNQNLKIGKKILKSICCFNNHYSLKKPSDDDYDAYVNYITRILFNLLILLIFTSCVFLTFFGYRIEKENFKISFLSSSNDNSNINITSIITSINTTYNTFFYFEASPFLKIDETINNAMINSENNNNVLITELKNFYNFFYYFSLNHINYGFVFLCTAAMSNICLLMNYVLSNKSREVMTVINILYIILVDVFFLAIVFNINIEQESFIFYIRFMNFFIFNAVFFILFNIETTVKEVFSIFIYKLILILISMFTCKLNRDINYFSFELGYFIICFVFLAFYISVRMDYRVRFTEFYLIQKNQNEYYQKLINLINKSFLSLNVTYFKINFNDAFINFLKVIGLDEYDINENINYSKNSEMNANRNSNANPPINTSKNNKINSKNNNNDDNNQNLQKEDKYNYFIQRNNTNNSNSIRNKSNTQIIRNEENDKSIDRNLNYNSSKSFILKSNENKENVSINSINNKKFQIQNINVNSSLENRRVNSIPFFNKEDNNKKIKENQIKASLVQKSLFNTDISKINTELEIINLNNPLDKKELYNNFSGSFISQKDNFLLNNISNNRRPLEAINSAFNLTNPKNIDNYFNFRGNYNNYKDQRLEQEQGREQNNDISQKQGKSKNIQKTKVQKRLERKMKRKRNRNLVNDEDIFLQKIDFLLDEVFSCFIKEENDSFTYQDTINTNNPNFFEKNKFNPMNSSKDKEKTLLADSIREIFYSKNKIDLNSEFQVKGIYTSLPIIKSKIIIELFFRRVQTYEGEIIEFYFNDITEMREKESQKIKSIFKYQVFPNIIHEIKLGYSLIGFILKNFLNLKSKSLDFLMNNPSESKNFFKNEMNDNFNNTNLKDAISVNNNSNKTSRNITYLDVNIQNNIIPNDQGFTYQRYKVKREQDTAIFGLKRSDHEIKEKLKGNISKFGDIENPGILNTIMEDNNKRESNTEQGTNKLLIKSHNVKNEEMEFIRNKNNQYKEDDYYFNPTNHNNNKNIVIRSDHEVKKKRNSEILSHKLSHLKGNSLPFKTNNYINFANHLEYVKLTLQLSDYFLTLTKEIANYNFVYNINTISYDFSFKTEFDAFDLYETMYFAFDLLKTLLTIKGLKDSVKPLLELDPNLPQIFYSDQKRVKEILINLIDNSLKFTKNGYIKLSAQVNVDKVQKEMTNFNYIKISVEDTGIGIPEEKLSKILNLFGRENILGPTGKSGNMNSFKLSNLNKNSNISSILGDSPSPSPINNIRDIHFNINNNIYFGKLSSKVQEKENKKKDIEKKISLSESEGIGLILIKQIIDKIGKGIHCSSTLNEKTIFSFVLDNKLIDSSKKQYNFTGKKNKEINFLTSTKSKKTPLEMLNGLSNNLKLKPIDLLNSVISYRSPKSPSSNKKLSTLSAKTLFYLKKDKDKPSAEKNSFTQIKNKVQSKNSKKSLKSRANNNNKYYDIMKIKESVIKEISSSDNAESHRKKKDLGDLYQNKNFQKNNQTDQDMAEMEKTFLHSPKALEEKFMALNYANKSYDSSKKDRNSDSTKKYSKKKFKVLKSIKNSYLQLKNILIPIYKFMDVTYGKAILIIGNQEEKENKAIIKTKIDKMVKKIYKEKNNSSQEKIKLIFLEDIALVLNLLYLEQFALMRKRIIGIISLKEVYLNNINSFLNCFEFYEIFKNNFAQKEFYNLQDINIATFSDDFKIEQINNNKIFNNTLNINFFDDLNVLRFAVQSPPKDEKLKNGKEESNESDFFFFSQDDENNKNNLNSLFNSKFNSKDLLGFLNKLKL